MSSFKKAQKSVQRSYKERKQPSFREEIGQLEHKKDYKVRALDRERKKKKLLRLKRLASTRNPDEFTRQMVVTKMEDGIHQCKPIRGVTDPDQIKLMTTQDKRYVENRRVMESRKAERLRSNLHLIEEGQRTNHIFFVDSKKEVREFDAARRLNTHPQLLERAYNRPTIEQLEQMDLTKSAPTPRLMAEVMVAKQEAYKELGRREKREKDLRITREKIEVESSLKEKDRHKRLEKPETRSSAAVYKYKPKRKK